jgi:flagellar basal body-associated protein FliL
MTGDLFLLLVVLMGLLILVVVVYVVSGAKKAPVEAVAAPVKAKAPGKRPSSRLTFDAAEAIILDRGSSREDLAAAVDAISRYYAQVHATTLSRYSRIIVSLCRHPRTNKDLVVQLDRALQKQSPNLHQELDAALKKGLNSRV